MQVKKIKKCWTFESSSGSKTYQTLEYVDGSTSCNCAGWTRRVAKDGTRSCKHTRAVDMGTADYDSIACKDYGTGKAILKVEETKVAPTRKVSWR